MWNSLFAVLFVLFLFCSPADCADFYIAQSQAGAHDGTSCANAYAYTWFNTAGSWANPKEVGKIGPGDTVHLCGTISAQLDILGSGSSGSPITIYWEQNAKLSRTVGTLISAINYSTPYVHLVFNGGTNGIIENTANGDSLANQTEVNGWYSQTTGFVEVKNLTFQNLYVRTLGESPPDAQGTGFYFNGMQGDLSIHDCTFHDIGTIITTTGTAGVESNFYFYNNTMSNYNHAIEIGGYFTTAKIYGNHFGECVVWSYPEVEDLGFHRDGIFVTFPNGVTAAGYEIYNNIFDGEWGEHSTAHIYFSGDGVGDPTTMSNFKVFNNSFIQHDNDDFPLIMGGGTGFEFYNNTFVGNGSTNRAITASCANWKMKNNLFSDFTTFFTESVISGYSYCFASNELDYNMYADGSATPFQYGGQNHSYSDWVTHTGQESNSQSVADAGVSTSTGIPTGLASAVVDSGMNLSALEIIALVDDILGFSRPSGSAWDIGAYEFDQGLPPTMLGITAAGVSINQ